MTSSNPAEWAGFEAPEGEMLAWKVVRPDGRTRGDFQWPFKGVVRVPKRSIIDHNGACPRGTGDGLCLAKTWAGAASGGIIAVTGLAISYDPADVLGSGADKLRVSRCRVLGVIDLQRLIREGNARGADLRGAHLDGADLRGAHLGGAHLDGAHLDGAHLDGAYLDGAYLGGAYLGGAHLDGAYLGGADLGGAIGVTVTQ